MGETIIAGHIDGTGVCFFVYLGLLAWRDPTNELNFPVIHTQNKFLFR